MEKSALKWKTHTIEGMSVELPTAVSLGTLKGVAYWRASWRTKNGTTEKRIRVGDQPLQTLTQTLEQLLALVKKHGMPQRLPKVRTGGKGDTTLPVGISPHMKNGEAYLRVYLPQLFARPTTSYVRVIDGDQKLALEGSN